jgi:RimJ/RimL family protein N-acetyltransferase
MQLVLERCTIRPWRLNDAESLARHANNRKVWLSLRDKFPHPYTTEDACKFLEATVGFEPITIFCIEVNCAAVGGIGIHLGIDVHRRAAELGYWLGEEFWARGIMTEAVGAFTDFCFDRFSLRRIYAEPFANNRASARVLEKAGFSFEGSEVVHGELVVWPEYDQIVSTIDRDAWQARGNSCDVAEHLKDPVGRISDRELMRYHLGRHDVGDNEGTGVLVWRCHLAQCCILSLCGGRLGRVA